MFRIHPEWFDAEVPSADQRICEWERATSPDSAELFDKRLAWDDLDRAAAKSVVGNLVIPVTEPRPQWLRIVADVLEALKSERVAVSDDLPFSDYWSPWIEVAIGRLESRAGTLWRALKPEPREAFVHSLRLDLA